MSLVVHAVLVVGIVWGISLQKEKKSQDEKRHVSISPDMVKVEKKAEPKPEPKPELVPQDPELAQNKEEEKKPGFMKTADEQEALESPKDPAYIGQRNTRLAGERPANPDGLDNLPSTEGEKRSDNHISLIEQERQEGDLEHETIGQQGVVDVTSRPSPLTEESVPSPQSPDSSDSQPLDPQKPTSSPADSGQELVPREPMPGEDFTLLNPSEKADPSAKEIPPDIKDLPASDDVREAPEDTVDLKESDTPTPSKLLENIMKTAEKFNLPDPTKPLPPVSHIASQEEVKQAQQQTPRKVVARDPAFVAGNKPGYRPEDKKTRITGKMSTTGVVAADVQSTPLGAYLAIFLRTLNKNWDSECIAKRDFIMPGSLKISMVLNKDGTTSGIRLITKEGGSDIQKGFTFKAIRETRVAPMSPGVIKELGEESTEVIIDFYF